MKQYVFLLLILYSAASFSQRIDNPWIMGYDCCTPDFSGINLDFSSGSLQVSRVHRTMNFGITISEISDGYGNLLFYSNGISVFNRNDVQMMNGDNLNPAPYTTDNADYGLNVSLAQIVIPFPDDSTKYYLFHETSDDHGNTNGSFYLYYSIIDMTLDNGLGGVVQKNTVLLADTLVPGQLTACRHANGRDWWLFTNRYSSFQNDGFLITPQGISGPFIQNMGAYRGDCQPVFSPDGTKFAHYSPFGLGINIWDFDRCTGLFSNHYHIPLYDTAYSDGTAFSASGRYLYISSYLHLYQFDMQAPDIGLSKIDVGDYDGFISFAQTIFYIEALAPDNKIYISSGSSVKYLHVINNPDSAGLACDFCQHCIFLDAFNFQTLPNFPNYYLGALPGSACDTIISDVHTFSTAVHSFNVFPNPAQDYLYITQSTFDPLIKINIYNSTGQQLQAQAGETAGDQYVKVNVQNLLPGLYSIEMISGKERMVKRFVKD